MDALRRDTPREFLGRRAQMSRSQFGGQWLYLVILIIVICINCMDTKCTLALLLLLAAPAHCMLWTHVYCRAQVPHSLAHRGHQLQRRFEIKNLAHSSVALLSLSHSHPS